MTFLQPLLLLALPLLAIPIIIHLLHLRRHRSTPWAAMQFLLQATKMSQGYNKLRQYLVLAARTLAIAALILLVARPLASGVSGWLASDLSELTIVVLDRSPSMQMQNGSSGDSKLTTAKQRLAEILSVSGERPVAVVTQGYDEPISIRSSQDLIQDLRLSGSSLTTNIPELLDLAAKHLEQTGAQKASIWIASDMRESDWRSASSGWGSVRNAFSAQGKDVRFQVLEFQPLEPNLAIEIIDCESQTTSDEAFLSLSFRIVSTVKSNGGTETRTTSVPVEIQIEQATSVTQVTLNDGAAEVSNLRIPIEGAGGTQAGGGYGALRLPPDANPADNVAYFAFQPAQARRTVIRSEQSSAVDAIRIAASISPDAESKSLTSVVGADAVDEISWDDSALVVWNLPTPTPDEQLLLEAFIESGGQVLLVPPANPAGQSVLGVTWLDWMDVLPDALPQSATAPGEEPPSIASDGGLDGSLPGEALASQGSFGQRVTQWRNDTRLLANTNSGEALPLSEVEIRRVCGMEFQGSVLAKIQSDTPWLVRLDPISDSAKGSVYALATDASPASSNLASNGIALYIVVQRLIDEGVAKKGNALLRTVAGTTSMGQNDTELLLGPEDVFSNLYFETAGVMKRGSDIYAQNRASSEDATITVSEESLGEVFGDLSWFRTDASDENSSLTQEIWRWFAIAMLVLLLVESMLTVPSAPKTKRVI